MDWSAEIAKAADVQWHGHWATVRHAMDTHPNLKSGTFADFTRCVVSDAYHPSKDGPSVITAKFKDDSARTDAHVLSCDLIGFDIDGVPQPDLDLVISTLRGREIATLIASTWSDGDPTPKKEGKPPRDTSLRYVRLLMPLSASLFVSDWTRLWSVLTQQLIKCAAQDTAARNPSRIWYKLRETNQHAIRPPHLEVLPGKPIDAVEWLKLWVDEPSPKSSNSRPVVDHTTPVNGELTPRVVALINSNQRLRAMFQGRGKGHVRKDGRPGDTSDSGYDYSVCVELIRKGVTDVGELASTIANRQNVPRKRRDYYLRTANEALKYTEVPSDGVDPLLIERVRAYQGLETLLITLEWGDLEVSYDQFASPTLFKRAIWVAFQEVVNLPKGKRWSRLVDSALINSERVPMPAEATSPLETALRDALEAKGTGQGFGDLNRGLIVVHPQHGKVFSLRPLLKSIESELGKISRKKAQTALKSMGCNALRILLDDVRCRVWTLYREK